MLAKTDPRDVTKASGYYYRRALSARELLPALGAGIAVGFAAFYVAQIVLQRTPLDPVGSRVPPQRRRERSTRARGG